MSPLYRSPNAPRPLAVHDRVIVARGPLSSDDILTITAILPEMGLAILADEDGTRHLAPVAWLDPASDHSDWS